MESREDCKVFILKIHKMDKREIHKKPKVLAFWVSKRKDLWAQIEKNLGLTPGTLYWSLYQKREWNMTFKFMAICNEINSFLEDPIDLITLWTLKTQEESEKILDNL